MIRVLLAAWLLRNTGADVQYIVRRRYSGTKGRGTSVLRASNFKQARAKYRAMRIADADTITITLAAVVAQRHGTVAASGAVSQSESEK